MARPALQRVRVHVWISGRVQGVGFRFFVQRRAHQVGVAGFVRNLPDGRVEATAEGPVRAVQELIDAVRTGPPGAVVTSVELTWEAPHDESRYVIRGDADA
jgi:acylphosphatase